MKATEAHSKARSHNIGAATDEYDDIMKRIDIQAESGFYYLYVEYSIMRETRDMLIDDGFTVNTGSADYTRIYW